MKTFIFFLALFFCSLFGRAQDCTLDIGGKHYGTVVEIFQFNAEQKATMETLRSALEDAVKGLEDDIQKLLDSHPQSTEEDLMALADKYRALQQKMVSASWETDKKMLATFNPKQYERYLKLCMEAIRKPIRIRPVLYKDSITPD